MKIGLKLWGLISLIIVLIQPSLSSSLSSSSSSSNTLNQQCHIPSKQTQYSTSCEYIKDNCDSNYFLISTFYYCSQYSHSIPYLLLVSALIMIGLTIILISLSILVSNYLFKNLNDLTKRLHINNQILGFMLVPLTNTFPDLINYNIALNVGSSDLVIGQLVGSIFITFTIIVGLICIMNGPFLVIHKRMMSIDFIWVLIILVIFFHIMSDGIITLVESVVMVICYGAYIIFLCYFDKEKLSNDDEHQALLIYHTDHNNIQQQYLHEQFNIEDALSILSNEEHQLSNPSTRSSSPILLEPESPSENSISISQYIVNSIDMMFCILVPLTLHDEEFNETHWKFKLYQWKPFHYWFYVEIPILLNYQFLKLDWITFIPYLIITSICLHLISTFILSSYPNLRHCLINIMGIIISLIILSEFTVEILKILKNFGLIWRISDYLLGLLVFSISNSINDLITNLTISTKINPILGINACLGSPLIVILLGIGFNGCLVIGKSITHEPIRFNLSINVVVSTVALIITVMFYLIYIPLNHWVFDRRAGIILLIWYVFITGLNCYLEK
ncbi:K+-dependent Na+:Ca2+ antiporter [Scheffersomyces coipomensis]|uniref:K+-dependent Na+:Ca2+ antiporter n=1 Tax=Scheffersomyces coipomensis TaxID=1788519 RepID=UPI00315D88DD